MTFTVEYEQESDGRWLAEVLNFPVCSPMVKLPIRQSKNPRPSRFASWPIAFSLLA
jgi:hypothetical protein